MRVVAAALVVMPMVARAQNADSVAGGFNLGVMVPGPSVSMSLTLGDSVEIDLKTGDVHLPPGVKISDAAKQFWDAVAQMAPMRQCEEKP